MKNISAKSKVGKMYIDRFSKSSIFSIHEVYKNPSTDKIMAFVNCCWAGNGATVKILGHNNFFFTAAWQTEEGLIVRTGRSEYLIKA